MVVMGPCASCGRCCCPLEGMMMMVMAWWRWWWWWQDRSPCPPLPRWPDALEKEKEEKGRERMGPLLLVLLLLVVVMKRRWWRRESVVRRVPPPCLCKGASVRMR